MAFRVSPNGQTTQIPTPQDGYQPLPPNGKAFKSSKAKSVGHRILLGIGVGLVFQVTLQPWLKVAPAWFADQKFLLGGVVEATASIPLIGPPLAGLELAVVDNLPNIGATAAYVTANLAQMGAFDAYAPAYLRAGAYALDAGVSAIVTAPYGGGIDDLGQDLLRLRLNPDQIHWDKLIWFFANLLLPEIAVWLLPTNTRRALGIKAFCEK